MTTSSPAAVGPRAYTIEAFCAAYGVGRTSAFSEIKNGRLQAKKVGKRTIIRAVDAEAWVTSLPARSTDGE